MMLHTVNKSPFEKTSLDSCLRLARSGSAILLIEDAVYAAARGTVCEHKLRQALGRCRVYALGADLQARGIDERGLIEGVEVVNYAGFVDLAVEHDGLQCWF